MNNEQKQKITILVIKLSENNIKNEHDIILQRFLQSQSNELKYEIIEKTDELKEKLESNDLSNFIESSPDIVIFDLYINNHNVAEKIIAQGVNIINLMKKNEFFKITPTIALIDPSGKEYIKKLYSNKVSCCIIKPENCNDFIKILESVKEFWFAMVRLPINML